MRRLFAVTAALLALALAGPASGFYRHAFIDETASWLAQREVHVRCLSPRESRADPVINFWGAAAYVEGREDRFGRWHPFDYTVFAYGHCGPLRSLRRADWLDYTMQEYAWAVLVLTHESGHLRGHRWSADEALTERWALRHYRYVALRLGADEARALELLRLAVEAHRKLPDDYLAPGCEEPWVDEAGLLRGCSAD